MFTKLTLPSPCLLIAQSGHCLSLDLITRINEPLNHYLLRWMLISQRFSPPLSDTCWRALLANNAALLCAEPFGVSASLVVLNLHSLGYFSTCNYTLLLPLSTRAPCALWWTITGPALRRYEWASLKDCLRACSAYKGGFKCHVFSLVHYTQRSRNHFWRSITTHNMRAFPLAHRIAKAVLRYIYSAPSIHWNTTR